MAARATVAPTAAQWRAMTLAAGLQRLMQALGAFAFLGHTKQRTGFLRHVPAAMRQLETRPDVVPRLLARLEAEQLDIDHLVALKRIAVATLPLSRDLINIAAQLSTRHMRCWIAIVAAISRLTEADSREQIEHPLHEMLTRLVEFDGLKH